MKKYFTGLLFMLAISAFATNTELLVNSKIKDVTVFVKGAEIKRTAQVDLKKGINHIVFTDLTPYLDQNTIQAGGKGAFTILSINYRSNYLRNKPKSKELLSVEQKLEALNDEKSLIAEKRNVLTEERKLILNNSNLSSEKEAVTADKLKAMADFYRARLEEISIGILDYNKKDHKLREDIDKYTKQLNELNSYRNKQIGEIVVEVVVDEATKGSLKLAYLTQQAGWVPHYEIRAKNQAEKIGVDFSAKVYQNTTTDWSNVNLKLSTGYPLRSNTKPSLHPWLLRFVQAYQRTQYDNRSFKLAAEAEMDMEDAVTNSGFSTTALGQVIENQLATEYKIELKYNVPTDGKHHSVLVRKMELPAEYKYYTAPKKDKDAFLLARVSGWEQYNLIPGETNLFYDGTYVGKSFLNTNVTSDTLDISLGRNRGIITDRKRIKDYTEKKVIGSSKKETIGIRLQVRNTRKQKVIITVEDQIPVSSDKEIDVDLLESSGAKFNKDTGILKWEMVLHPGEKKEVVFKYSVKYPKEKKINL